MPILGIRVASLAELMTDRRAATGPFVLPAVVLANETRTLDAPTGQRELPVCAAILQGEEAPGVVPVERNRALPPHGLDHLPLSHVLRELDGVPVVAARSGAPHLRHARLPAARAAGHAVSLGRSFKRGAIRMGHGEIRG